MNRLSPIVAGIVITVVLGANLAHSQSKVDETVATHIRELKDKDPNVRSFAATSLGRLGEQAAPAVPALMETLADQDQSVRRQAAAALGCMGPAAKNAVPALTDFLGREDSEYGRETALQALARIAPAVVTNVPDLIVGLKSSDKARRRWSVEALALLEEDAKLALNELTTALQDKEPEVRAAAAVALRNLRETARPAVGALVGALTDGNAKVRENAAEALHFIGPGTEDAVPALIKAISDSDNSVRSNAASSFTTNWPGGERAIPALIKALDDSDPTFGVPIGAGHSLSHLARHGHSQTVVPALLEYLKKPSKTGESTAIRTLRNIGGDAKSAIPALEERLKSGDASLRGAAVAAISSIGGSTDEGMRVLLADLQSVDFSIRESALESLARIGPAASAAVPELVALLGDQKQRAFAAFQKAAEKGVAEAQFNLALLYLNGRGTPPDIAAAVAWLQKAADQGHSEAQRNLGILYRQGRGVPQDDRQAEKWYRLSSLPSGALARLRGTGVIQAAYEAALESHRTGVASRFGSKAKLIVTVTGLNHDASLARHRQVHADGAINAFRDVYNWATQGGGTPTRTPAEMEQIAAVLRKLPQGVEFVPLHQALFISYSSGSQWTTRKYDFESLPSAVRLLLDLIDAPAGAVPFPPLERMSWRTTPQLYGSLFYRPNGTLCSYGGERKIDHWDDGRLAKDDDVVRDVLRGYPIAVSAEKVVTWEAQLLKLWDVKSGQHVADLGESGEFNGHLGLNEASFSADGQTLAIQQLRHHRVQIRDATTGRLRGQVQAEQFFASEMALTPDGKQLALSCADQTIRIWDLETFKVKRELGSPQAASLTFSPDGKNLAAVSHSNLTVWDTTTGKQRFQTTAGDWTRMLCFTPDGATIVGRRGTRLLKLWDARSGRVLGIAEGHTADITALAISPDGQEIASSSDDGVIKVWNIERLMDQD